jgi:hypothetical protein
VIRSLLLTMAIIVITIIAAWAVLQSSAMVDAQAQAEFALFLSGGK